MEMQKIAFLSSLKQQTWHILKIRTALRDFCNILLLSFRRNNYAAYFIVTGFTKGFRIIPYYSAISEK